MSISNKIIKGIAWSMFERISVQTIQFILGIILARILSPSEYGTIGLLTVIISFLQVFVDGGFSKALIQKQKRTEVDLSTVFFFNVFISCFCYILIWIAAPYIALFYEKEILTSIMRILSLSLLFNALFTIPMTLLTIKLDFKTIGKINLIGVILSGVIAIIMAYSGYGIWSLVAQTIIKSMLTVILMWWLVKWKPLFVFSKASFKTLFPYGSKLLLSSILNMSVNNFSNVFIAKLSSTKDLGFYTRGSQFPDIVFSTFNSVLDSVLLPSLASIQNEREKLIQLTRLSIKSSALFAAPIFLLLAIIAEPLVKVLLTEKWLAAVPIIQVLCTARLISIISGINVNLLYVIGRTDLALKQQYLKLIIRIIFLILALNYGIYFIALAELLSTIINFFINTFYPSKMLNYGSLTQIKDLLPIFFSSVVMIVIIYFLDTLIINDIIFLIFSPVIGLLIYIFLIYKFRLSEFFLIIHKLKIGIQKIRS
jgi:teichuronic acid exporter